MSSAGDRTANLRYRCLAADKWSRYPAVQDVDMGCNSIINLERATFCDGTYIGPGSSFNIDTDQDLNIKSSTKVSIMSSTNDITLDDADRLITIMTGTDTLTPNIITFGPSLDVRVTDNITFESSADISISTDNSNGLITLSTRDGQQTFTMYPDYSDVLNTYNPVTTIYAKDDNANEASIILRPAQYNISLTSIKNGVNNANITLDGSDGAVAVSAGVRYKNSQTLSGVGSYTPTSSDYALSFPTSTTITMPVITATNVGQQYIITNTGIAPVSLTIQTPGGSSQSFYTKTGNVLAITVSAGYSYIFTAIKTTSNTTYGWSAI